MNIKQLEAKYNREHLVRLEQVSGTLERIEIKLNQVKDKDRNQDE